MGYLQELGVDVRTILKFILNKLGDWCGFYSSGSGNDLVMDGLDTS
jgi:hypothetical protein